MASFADLNAIANDATFQGRCLYALNVAAVAVLAEDNKAASHQRRTDYAVQVLAGAVPGLRVALAVLTNATIAGEASVAQLATTAGVPDGDIQFAVNSTFNALAGIGS